MHRAVWAGRGIIRDGGEQGGGARCHGRLGRPADRSLGHVDVVGEGTGRAAAGARRTHPLLPPFLPDGRIGPGSGVKEGAEALTMPRPERAGRSLVAGRRQVALARDGGGRALRTEEVAAQAELLAAESAFDEGDPAQEAILAPRIEWIRRIADLPVTIAVL